MTDSGPNEGCGMAWPPGLETLKRYLNNPETKKSLNATNKYWEECSNSVPNALDRDTSPASISLLPSLLSKMEIVLFNGDMDYICNWLGIDYMIGNMTWADHTGFQNPSKYDWVIDGNSVGNYKKERNLTFIIVYNSSHMAPIDQGAAALDLVLGEIGQNRFGKLIDLNPPSNIKNITSIIDIDYAGYHSFFGYLLVIGGLFLIVYSCLWYRRRSSMGRGKHIIDGGVQWHELTNIDEEDGLFSGEIGWDEK